MERFQEAESELEALKTKLSEYGSTQASVNNRTSEARRELHALLSQRPQLVAEVALGLRDNADIIQSRERIRELRDEIDENSDAHSWFEQRRKELKEELDRKAREPGMYRLLLRDYEQYKNNLPLYYKGAKLNKHARVTVTRLLDDFRSMARTVNREEEAEGILAGYEIPES